MKQYELETGTIGFVEVEQGAKAFKILGKTLNYEANPFMGYRNYCGFDLPEGDWLTLGIFTELKEEDIQEFMPLIKRVYGQSYYDYMVKFKVGFGYVGTALQSIHSLAQHLGLDTTQPIFVIFKPR